VAPVRCAERYAGARVVAFSTGNVYPLTPATRGGAREEDPLSPLGEYAASCVGRERVFEHLARERGTRLAIFRLNYAVDLRYGVLVDLARRGWAGEPVDVTMGYVNVTGPLRLAVRDVVGDLGALLGRAPVITGTEADDALLSDTARMRADLGEVTVDYWTLVTWVADWLKRGGRMLGKATKYEVRDGKF
jgi:hypothetical protein